MDALFVGIRDFPTEKIILLAPTNKLRESYSARDDLKRFQIPCRIIEIEGNIWEEMFCKVAELTKSEKNIIVNTATGDRTTTCAATSAAFVNGLKAISVEGSETMLLPVLKFSYYKLLTDKKLGILKALNRKNEASISLNELAQLTKMSLPLISYHINGNLKSEGLVELGLVEVEEEKGRVLARLSMLGRLLIKGYVQCII